MKRINKNNFKKFSDLLYVLNHIPCKECKKVIFVSEIVYHGLSISGLLK